MKALKLLLITIAILFALFVIIGISADSPAERIESVLKEEAQLTQTREAHDGTGVREKLAAYTNGLQKLDTRNCPSDFREAFQIYLNAWIGLTREMQTQPDSIGEGFLFGALNTLAGEADGGVNRMAAARGHWESEIQRASFQVTQIAAKHGAQIH